MRITIHQQATCLQLPHQSKNTIYPVNKRNISSANCYYLSFQYWLTIGLLVYMNVQSYTLLPEVKTSLVGQNYGFWFWLVKIKSKIGCWVLESVAEPNNFEESDTELDSWFHLCVELEPRFLRILFCFSLIEKLEMGAILEVNWKLTARSRTQVPPQPDCNLV